jgi:hypothetical protein
MASATVEKARPNLFLKGFDLQRYGGLRKIETLGCLSKT